MTYTYSESPDTLRDGAWVLGSDRVLVWVTALEAIEREINQAHLLIACPTCRARVGETCKATREQDGRRRRRRPHVLRLAPRLCICGALLAARRQLCDGCRDEVNRENKREHMRRVRAQRRAEKDAA